MGEAGGHQYHIIDGLGGPWLAETTSEYPEPIGIGRVDDILRAAAAPDALRVRIEALAAEIEDPRTQRPGMQRRRIWSDRLRALLLGEAHRGDGV